ncbi:DUF1801 domain-containing protein [Rhodobacteraceae bacterium CCMM004]|nr:DUF1801 domain-containing protein [Rhodobacteraceae bacterium CCMM004]
MAAVTVDERIAALPEDRQAEARRLDAIFRDVTGWAPRMWGKLIGYGHYHYVYDSGREGDFLATGFSPLARQISLHILPGYTEFPEIADRLGKHSRGKSCWYIKRLADVDEAALRDLIAAGLDDLRGTWEVRPT